MMKRFSVIIPVYKQSRTLGACIESVKDQDWREKEIIVVLDGPDKDAERIASISGVDKILCTGDRNLGAPVARNLGAKQANGDYYVFTDADEILYPGALRSWAEAFDEDENAAFVYGGFKIKDAHSYPSQEFDPYFLTVHNYIDTGFPMKCQVFPGFDPNLKSLQDWDMWLTVVKNGNRGVYLKGQYFYEKESGRPGSISEDSSKNWLKRMQAVKDKHKIKDRRVCLTSFAAEHHGRRCAKLMGFDYMDPMMLFSKPHKYEGVMIVGWFPGQNGNPYPFMDGSVNPPTLKKDIKRFISWIGTDVLQMSTMPIAHGALKALAETFNDKFTSFSQSSWLKEELDDIGIKNKVIPLPVLINNDNIPKPDKFTVGIYDHGRNDIYNKDFMVDIARATPDIEYKFFGDPSYKGKTRLKNVESLGHKPINEVMKEVSCLLRITKHDGYPVSVPEFLSANRAVITNVDMPYCTVIKSMLTDKGVVNMKKEIISAIRKLIKRYPSKKFFDLARAHYERELNPSKMRKEILKCL